MEETLQLLLPYGYEPPTDKDVRQGKKYVLQREKAAATLAGLIDSLLQDAAERITRLAYQYNADGMVFQISSEYNEKLFEAIAQVLDELDSDIMDTILEYATMPTNDDRRASLLIWILALGRDNMNLQQTLDSRIWKFSRDLEAMIAAMLIAKRPVTEAVTAIRQGLRTVYLTPEVRAAFRYAQQVNATYIKSRGVKYGDVGQSNSEANNIVKFGKTTLQMAWMHDLMEKEKENGRAGYFVFRGSTYPCQICDDNVGIFHPIDKGMVIPTHPACCCYAVFVSEMEENNSKENLF